MVKMLIIADDFTGALDTGIQFAKRGIRTQVFTNSRIKEEELNPDTEVLVVDTESRPLSGPEAYAVVREAADWAVKQGIEIIFKKTDSALRGNIGMELQAASDAVAGQPLFFLPGHPKIGRTTSQGVHYIEGRLIEDSIFGKDPFEPVRHSFIPDVIKEQSKTAVRCIGLPEQITAAVADGSGVVVCDTKEVADIDRRLDELIQMKKLKVIAGCAALGECLVKKIPFQYTEKKTFEKTKGIYVACGSLNKITTAQVEYAEQYGGFRRRHLSMEQKLDENYYDTDRGKAFLAEMIILCRENSRLIVDSFDIEEDKEAFLKQHWISAEKVRTLIPVAHGHIVKALMDSELDITVLMTGGDTLMGYMKLINCTQIEPVCEIGQGIVVSRIKQNGATRQVISKSGGFGTKETLCEIAKKII